MFNRVIRKAALVLAIGGIALTSACSGADPDQAASANPSASGSSVTLPTQQVNDSLRNALPAEIRDAGTLVSVNNGSFPPYEIIQADGSMTGASADLTEALAQLWGITITHETVDGLSSILTGMQAGRYRLAFGPIGDFKSREESADFVDYVNEHVVFAVLAGNPKNIDDVASTCGLRISVMAAGSAERVINAQSEACVAQGKPAIEVLSFKDQPQAVLAVQSGRADGFFSSQAPLTYFVAQSNGALELTGQGHANGFDALYQGAVIPKDDPLRDVLLASLEELFENGTYDAIMAKWDLDGNKVDAPGINMAVN